MIDAVRRLKGIIELTLERGDVTSWEGRWATEGWREWGVSGIDTSRFPRILCAL